MLIGGAPRSCCVPMGMLRFHGELNDESEEVEGANTLEMQWRNGSLYLNIPVKESL